MLRLGYSNYGLFLGCFFLSLSPLRPCYFRSSRPHRSKPTTKLTPPSPFSSSNPRRRLGLLDHANHGSSLPHARARLSHKLHAQRTPELDFPPSSRPPTSPYTLHSLRPRRPQTIGMVRAARKRLQRHPSHQTANNRLLPLRLTHRPISMDLRKTARLVRQLPLDRRRGPHLGIHLLVLHRWPRSLLSHLLRIHA